MFCWLISERLYGFVIFHLLINAPYYILQPALFFHPFSFSLSPLCFNVIYNFLIRFISCFLSPYKQSPIFCNCNSHALNVINRCLSKIEALPIHTHTHTQTSVDQLTRTRFPFSQTYKTHCHTLENVKSAHVQINILALTPWWLSCHAFISYCLT